MSIIKSFFNRVYLFFLNLLPSQKVVLANQDAIKKMEEMNKSLMLTRITELEKQLIQISKDLKNIIEFGKTSQEFLLYLCTTNEELLNTLSEGEVTVIGSGDEDNIEEDFIDSHWVTKKGNNMLN